MCAILSKLVNQLKDLKKPSLYKIKRTVMPLEGHACPLECRGVSDQSVVALKLLMINPLLLVRGKDLTGLF